MSKKVMFLTLKTFSATGGIEKVCRLLGKVLHEYSIDNKNGYCVFSLYDKQVNAIGNRYFPVDNFKAFKENKFSFLFNTFLKSRKFNVIIVSHVNLLPIGWVIKKIYPKKKLLLIAHGIEVWGSLNMIKSIMLKQVDMIVSVSNFTRSKMQEIHHSSSLQYNVINNCIDPLLDMKVSQTKVVALRNKLNIAEDEKVIFTLSRLSKADRKKGCENVIRAMITIKKIHKGIKYVIGGDTDLNEREYLLNLASSLGLYDSLLFTGFIPDDELGDYYTLADVFILPSMKEGFGSVFAEAMYFRTPVIGGSKDGSVDALCNGQLGTLIDPLDINSIEEALINVLNDKDAYRPNKNLLLSKFSFDVFKMKWIELLNHSVKLI